MAELLYTNRYVKPGCYIGQLITPSASIVTASRIPTAIGKGSKYALSNNATVVRSYVYDEDIKFSETSPYRATLKNPALMDSDKAVLVRVSDNSEIPESKWYFEDETHIIISEDSYEAGDFQFSYQSTSSSITDPAPVNDIMSFASVGDTPDSQKYKEGKDFFLEMSMSDITKGGESQDYLKFDSRYNAESLYPTCTGPVPSVQTSGSLLFDVSNFKSKKNYICNMTVVSLNRNTSGVLQNITFDYTYQECNDLGEVIPNSTEYKATVTIDNDNSYHVVFAGVKVLVEDSENNQFNVGDTFNDLLIVAGRIFLTAKDNRTVKLKLSAKDEIVLETNFSEASGDYASLLTEKSYVGTPTTVGTWTYSVSSGALITEDTEDPEVKKYYFPITVSYQVGDFVNTVTTKVEATKGGEEPNPTYSLTGAVVDCGDKTSITLDGEIIGGVELFKFSRTVSKADESAKAQFYYTSNTSEGGFGTIDVYTLVGTISLPGNIIINYDITDASKGDEFEFNITNLNKLNWNLTQKVTETYKTSDVYKDVNGSVTGIFGSYYISLAGIPLNGIFITTKDTSIRAIPVLDANGNYTSFVRFVDANDNPVKPIYAVQVTYEFKGSEPEPGSTYYVSTLHTRPNNLFNSVQVISSREEGRVLFGPATPTNDLYIANELAWDELGNTAGAQVAFIQIKDSDDDGVFNTDDVRAAIDACQKSKFITDVTLLGFFEHFSYLLRMNQDANDPFAMRENEVWAGCPIDTPVGDVNTEGSLVFTAKQTMKVYGNDPCHGTRILVGSTWAKRSVTMSSGKSQTVTMDGSFIAFALACLRVTLPTSESILRKNLSCFSDMQVWDDVSNDKLGAAQIIYFSKIGTGSFRIEEDFTVDTYAFEFTLEQITSQRLTTVRSVRSYIDENLVGETPDTPQAGINLVTDFLIRGLNRLVADGTISNYLDENGNKRPINAATDIFVQNVKDNPTQYQFGFSFYTKKVMKQFFGIYVVDKNFSSTGLGNS